MFKINKLKEINDNRVKKTTNLKDDLKCSSNKNNGEKFKLIPEDIKAKTFYVAGEELTDNEENNFELLSKYINFENAYFVTENYTIVYKCLSAGQLNNCLESIDNKGMFFAGDINASSGYEEAAYQGYIVGKKALQYLDKNNKEALNYSGIENNFIKYINSKKRKETFYYFDIENSK